MHHDLEAESLWVILVQSEVLIETEDNTRHVIEGGDIVKGLSIFIVVLTYEG